VAVALTIRLRHRRWLRPCGHPTGPNNDDMQATLELAGDPQTLLKAINELGRRQLEEMFLYHGVHILGGG